MIAAILTCTKECVSLFHQFSVVLNVFLAISIDRALSPPMCR